jgi:tripartite-type tricarboxylate transporter receptor subunit TctC
LAAARLNTEINKILAEQDVRNKLAEQGTGAAPISVEQFVSFVKSESNNYRYIIEGANLQPQRRSKKD